MDLRELLRRLRRIYEKAIVKIAPYTHFIPASVRHKASEMLFRVFRPVWFRKPEKYVPGHYPAGVNLFGFFKAENGLAQAVKLYAASIEKAGIPHRFLNTDFIYWLPQNDKSFDTRLSDKAEYAINVVHINPDQWKSACGCFPLSTFDKRYTIGVWLWELETIPENWHACFQNVNELWAPSEFIAKALRKASPVPVTVMPYGIAVPCDETVTRAQFGLPEDRFLVLTMFDSNSYSSRKNPRASMEAFKKAYADVADKVMLVIKVNNPKPEDVAAIKEAMGDIPCTLITERMDKPVLNALIRLCDVFISLHRSEGFGLVMAEAMALGTPAVATNWSSNTEFMDEESACMVDYKLIPVQNNYQFGQPEHRWADADVDHAASYLRRLYDDPAYYQQKAQAGKRKIEEEFSIEVTAERIKNRVNEILA